MGIFETIKKKTSRPATKAAALRAEKAPKPEAAVEKTPAPEAKAPRAVSVSGRAHVVLLRPFTSEKAAISEASGKYTFVVDRSATKVDVRNAVLALYGVAPVAVRVINMEGKETRFGRMSGRRSDWKKAIVTLPAGKSISIHEGV